jgi:plastocyanin
MMYVPITRSLPALVAAVMAGLGCSAPQPHPTRAGSALPAPHPTDTVQTSASGAQVQPAPAATDTTNQYLSFDPATNTVTFKLVAGPFAFNGFTGGGATLTVPPGSTNVMNFVQDDGTPHSAEIATGTGPIPNTGGDPAIPRAYTNKVVEGLPQGATDVMRFTAPDSGTYRIICGVPGHALSGMWIWFKVDPAAKTPSFGPTSP